MQHLIPIVVQTQWDCSLLYGSKYAIVHERQAVNYVKLYMTIIYFQ